MSFINDKSNFEAEPLYPGHYYLVDCSEVIQEFMTVPSQVRMHMAGESDELTEYDMIDVELTEIMERIGCVNPVDGIDQHVEYLLDEGQQVLAQEAENQGQHKPGKVYRNTPEQIEHADAVMQLGYDMSKLLKTYGFYDKEGHLQVEYHQLLPGGLVAFRKAEHSFM